MWTDRTRRKYLAAPRSFVAAAPEAGEPRTPDAPRQINDDHGEENSMQPRPCILSAFALSTAMAFGVLATAADLPKQGTDRFTNNWVITQMNSIKAGDRLYL